MFIQSFKCFALDCTWLRSSLGFRLSVCSTTDWNWTKMLKRQQQRSVNRRRASASDRTLSMTQSLNESMNASQASGELALLGERIHALLLCWRCAGVSAYILYSPAIISKGWIYICFSINTWGTHGVTVRVNCTYSVYFHVFVQTVF